MRRRLARLSIVGLMTGMVLLSGCGSSGGNSFMATEEMATEAAYDNGLYDYKSANYDYEMEAPMAGGADTTSSQAQEVIDTSRKLITTMNISAEAENLDPVLASVTNKVKELGGYIESSNIYNGSRYSGKYVTRDCSMTLRIPADKLEAFLETIEGATNITNKSTNVEDVTLQYVDIESRKNALKAEEKRLLEIVNTAETVEDIITVEDRLADVRYQLESIESQLRTYDNRVNYSTVYLDITEVTKYTPVAEKGPVERMLEGFVDSCKSMVDTVVEAFVWFVIHIPQIILLIVLGLICFIVIKKIIAKSKKKALERAALQAQYMNQNTVMGQTQYQNQNAANTQAQYSNQNNATNGQDQSNLKG